MHRLLARVLLLFLVILTFVSALVATSFVLGVLLALVGIHLPLAV